MGLFGKKKEQTKSCCAGTCNAETMKQAVKAQSEGADIKVLGGGCAKCHELENNVKAALKELEIHTQIELVTDFTQIASYGVMTTPALVINEKLASYGKVLKKEEIICLLKENL